MAVPHRLFCFGLGYTGLALAKSLQAKGWHVAGTCRDQQTARALMAHHVDAVVFDSATIPQMLAKTTHLLSTVPPSEAGDPVLARYGDKIAAAPHLQWAGYLSTTGVYGDCDGAWVTEASPIRPLSPRGERRVAAEQAWCNRQPQLPLQIFRLAGIYGPGRNALASLAAGTARRIVKPGQVFSRIHRDDIVQTLIASMAKPNPGAIYNVCDDAAAPPQDVIAFAAQLRGQTPPPEIPIDDALISPMARSFYAENKRVSNQRLKRDLGITLAYPDYRAGLTALFAAGEGR